MLTATIVLPLLLQAAAPEMAPAAEPPLRAMAAPAAMGATDGMWKCDPVFADVNQDGNLDLGATAAGYIGILLLASANTAIGLFVSSKTDNQIVSLIGSVTICGLLHLVGNEAFTGFFGYRTAEWLGYFSSSAHLDSMLRGVLDPGEMGRLILEVANRSDQPVLVTPTVIGAGFWLDEPGMALAYAVFIAGVVQLLFQLPFLARIHALPRPRWRPRRGACRSGDRKADSARSSGSESGFRIRPAGRRADDRRGGACVRGRGCRARRRGSGHLANGDFFCL